MRLLLVIICLLMSSLLGHATLIGDQVDYWHDIITGSGDPVYDESYLVSTGTVQEGYEEFGWFDVEATSIHWAHQGASSQIWPEEIRLGFSFRNLNWIGSPLGQIAGFTVEYGGSGFRGNVTAGSDWVAFDFAGLGISQPGDWMTVTLSVSHVSGTSVPDSGSALALLGISLAGLGFARRQLI